MKSLNRHTSHQDYSGSNGDNRYGQKGSAHHGLLTRLIRSGARVWRGSKGGRRRGGVKLSSSSSQVPHYFVLAVLGLWAMNGLSAGMFWKAAGPSVNVGQWSVYSDAHPLKDKPFEAVRLHAARGGNAWSGYPELWIKCDGGQTQMYIYWSDDLGPEPQPVSLQLDEEVPLKAVWPKSLESSATPFPGSAVSTIKMMMQADMVVAETMNRKGEIITAEFATTRLSDAVERVRQSCKW